MSLLPCRTSSRCYAISYHALSCSCGVSFPQDPVGLLATRECFPWLVWTAFVVCFSMLLLVLVCLFSLHSVLAFALLFDLGAPFALCPLSRVSTVVVRCLHGFFGVFVCVPLSASVCLCLPLLLFHLPSLRPFHASLRFSLAFQFSAFAGSGAPSLSQEFFHVLVFRSARTDLLLPLFDVFHCVCFSCLVELIQYRRESALPIFFCNNLLYSDLILSLFLGSFCLAVTSQFLGDYVERLLYCHAVLLCDPLSRAFACFCCSWLNSIFGTAFASSS